MASSTKSNSQTDILVLAQQIKDLSTSLVEYLSSTGQEAPNLSISSPIIPQGDKNYNEIRNKLNDAAFDLLLLANGSKTYFRKLCCQGNDLAAYQIAFDFDLFNIIPKEQPMHLTTISEKTGLDVGIAGRVLRFLATQRIFHEVEKNTFTHTRDSVVVKDDEYLHAAVHYSISEMLQAASVAGPAVKDGVEPFTKRHGCSAWEYYTKDPKSASRFAKAMTGIAKVDMHMEGLFNGFPWGNLGDHAKVVDIGGGSGHVSVKLARTFPNLSIVVQDNDLEMLKGAKALDLIGIEDRLTYMQHDFFEPQPVADADVYFLRHVLHNWNDEDCARILKALVPVLEKCKPGTPVLINEAVVPETGTITRFEENLMRQIDMHLMISYSSKQRTPDELSAILKKADSRFHIAAVHSYGMVGLVEVHLDAALTAGCQHTAGCRLPGGVSKPSDLWALLAEKRSGYTEFDKSRLNLDGYYHPNPQRPGTIHTKGGQLLDSDPRLFDHAFFSVQAAEVPTMDLMQRKILEVSYEAMEAAGETWNSFWGSNTGVFMGNFNYDGHVTHSQDRDFEMPYTATGASPTILSNRVNHLLNLKGPSLTVDTACASSMYALHLAVNALRAGDCDAAIVGGMNLISNPDMQQMVVKLGAASGTSTCHSFDEAADGYCRSEGFGALYLRRYADAVEKDYPIRAVVRGTAINHNGRSAGISHPSSEGQEILIRHAYANAGLPTHLTGYVECHGTGTPVGDPAEVSAVSRAFCSALRTSTSGHLLIGSVKSNLGHSEAASGVTGVMKSVLALEHGMIPATIGIKKLNPNIDFESARVQVVTEMTPWPVDKLRRISVNSFGFGGANGHAIIDHPDVVAAEMRQKWERHYNALLTPPSEPRELDDDDNSKKAPATGRLVLLPFSAHDKEALTANVQALGEVVDTLPLADVAYTLSERRSTFLYKTFAVVDANAASQALSIPPTSIIKSASTQPARVGFIFTGQGAQWKAMGRALFEYGVFALSVAAMDSVLASLSIAPSWSLKEVLNGASERSVQEAEVSQTVCAALQIGIVDLFRSWSIVPHATVGHSSGEIAAAYAAGRLSRSEAVVLAYCRAKAITFNPQNGAMLAVGLSLEEAHIALQGLESQIKVAAVNSPSSVTLSGDAHAVTELHQKLQAEGTFARLLQTDGNAYHSHHMLPIGERYQELLKTYLAEVQSDPERPPAGSWVSSVTPREEPIATALYWRKNLESAVLFSPAVEHLVTETETRVEILIEIGPHSALQNPVKQIVTAAGTKHAFKPPIYLSALRRFEDGVHNLLSLCGSLFQLNHSVDLSVANNIHRNGHHGTTRNAKVCIDMPTYRFAYGPILCYENRITRELRERPFLHHDLLGLLRPGGSKDQPVWRNVLRMKDVPWLSDHRLLPNAVLPGSAYICLAIEAGSQYAQTRGILPESRVFKLSSVQIKNALIIPEDDVGIEVMTSITASSFSINWLEFKVTSVDSEGKWTDNAKGLISVATAPARESMGMKRLDEKMDVRYMDAQRWYSKFEEIGLGYGKSFQGLSNLVADPYKHIAKADVNLSPTAGMFNGPESEYAMHPAALDICFQIGIIATHGGQVGRVTHAHIPLFVGEINIWPASGEETTGQVIAQSEKRGLRNIMGSIQVFDENGLPRVEAKNFKGVRYDGEKGLDAAPQLNEYVRLIWKPDISTLSSSQAEAVIASIPDEEPYQRLTGLIDLLGHRDPNTRILQIGAHNVVSRLILRTLGGHTDTMRYDIFTIADKSSELLQEVEDALSEFKFVTTRFFDLKKEEEEQNVEDGYDVIIVADGLEAVDDISIALLRLRILSKVDGKLIIMNSARGETDWNPVLTANAYSEVEVALQNAVESAPILMASVTSVVPTASNLLTSDWMYIIYQHTITPFHQSLVVELQKRKIMSIVTKLSHAGRIPDGSRAIMTMDLEEKGGLFDATEEEYNSVKAAVQKVSSLLWLTRGDVMGGQEPKATLATGMMRMLTSEKPESRFSIFHLGASLNAARVIEREMRLYSGNTDVELALDGDAVYIPRLLYDSGLSARFRALNSHSPSTAMVPIHSQGRVAVEFAVPGLTSSLYFKPDQTVEGPLPDGWIEIKTAALGLNWKDLIMASGRATSGMDMNSCTGECAGTVVACGPGVTRFQPGDRVFSLVVRSWFGTHIRTPASLAQKMKPEDTFEKMCTIPVAFTTAVYGLIHLGRLGKGQRVLIQTATGGLGLAAIQVAKACGADIFATAGTPEKRTYLTGRYGIAEDHIFSSRDESDTTETSMMAATGGKGFNVILSTSMGDMLHAAWRCISPRGVFIDVGRMDVVDHSMLGLNTFERNATFTSFDLSVMLRQDPEFVYELMDVVGSMLSTGTIQPLDEIRTYDVSKLDSALLSLSKGTHIGKFVVSYENPDSLVKMVSPVSRAKFDPDAEFVLVGGLGGFGRSTLRWLVVHGARHITVFRRSTTIEDETQIMLNDLSSQGATVNLRQVDVTSRNQVEAALGELSSIRPVKGIMHAAMTPADTTFDQLPYSTWKYGLGSKVEGTINLHEASLALALPLDWFVLTGSVMAVTALPAHLTYCTANSFQEAFARYRKSLGLPACTISLGLITETTAWARRDTTLGLTKRNHLYGNGELETMQLFEAAFLETPAEVGGDHGWQNHDPLAEAQMTGSWDPSKMVKVYVEGPEPVWHKNKKFLHVVKALKLRLHASDRPLQSNTEKPAVGGAVDAAIGDDHREEAVNIIAAAISGRIAELLEIEMESIDPSSSVAVLGVDSMLAVELRSFIVAALGQQIPLLQLLDERKSIIDLAEALVTERIDATAQMS
ncbi:hypothetical protein CC80DRAFT_531559 [Byssothecium circinans]|uniref:Uncharacterized protein n=1 Tax=Byssothecium circinans TaxID=147558 RepID=A0A6A5UKX4_9PLEO|nr:hypothetical protein CC80DRAFT_531559 [Byssothecium circinans]